MDNNSISVIPDNAVTELSKNLYTDVGHPVLNEVGNIGAAIMKFVALPFKFLGLTAEELEIKYSAFLKKTIGKIPEEKCILPKGVVAYPLLDHVKFVFDEDNLSEMFSNLLANAMCENIEKMVHPAFVEMLKQMSPLDVEFMNLYFAKNDIVEISDIKWNRGEHQYSLTVDSLLRLGIINSISYDDRDDVALKLSDFGIVFRNLCMMSPAEIDPDDFFCEDDKELCDEYIDSSDIGFVFGDSFGTARKSKSNGRIYIRQQFQMQDVNNGSDIVIILRINNISDKNRTIDSLYIECNKNKHIVTNNHLPARIPADKYMDFVFIATSKNGLLDEVIKDETKYVFQTGSTIYDLPITSDTKKEIKNFVKYYLEKESNQEATSASESNNRKQCTIDPPNI